LTAYADYKQISIGYGTKSYPWETITAEEAEKRLTEAVRARFDRVKDLNLTDNQKASLVSYIYNTWWGNVLKYAARWDHKSVRYIMNRTVYAWWKKLRWLVTRRNAEVELYNKL